METFDKFWNYTLFTISGGGQINVSQVITTALFILIAVLLGRFLMLFSKQKPALAASKPGKVSCSF